MNVPQLRFDGFNEEWEVKKLSDVAITKGGFAFPSQRFKNEKSNYQVIKMGNLYNNKLDLDRSPSYLESISNRDQEYLLNEGDIIITLTGTVHKTDFGYSHMITNEKNLLVNQRLALVKSKANSDSFFLLNLIRHKRFLQQFFTSSIGGTGNQANVSTKAMEGFSIVTPSLLEQKKISNFFTLLNNRISKQQEKIEKLEQFKKGMMQKIFSQELRFKGEDGEEFGEWEEKTIGNFLSESRIVGSKGDTALKLTVKLWGKGIVAKREAIQGSANTQYYVRREGQLMYGKLDFLNCAFGIIPAEFDGYESTLDSPAFDIQNINSRFLLEYITREEFYLKYGSQANGSRRAKRIHPDVFFEMPIKVPSMEEQNKIGLFLSLLDEKVEKEKEKLMVLEEQKKGFMQGMFV